MNRETESRFRNLPTIDHRRSKFKKTYKALTTLKVGELTPLFMPIEVLPGDTFTMDLSAVVRQLTPLYPVMDDLIFDIFAFYVPNRLVWDHWQEFLGENKLTAWEQPVEYEIPQLEAPEGGWRKGTLRDKFGIPTYIDNLSVSALPFRAYSMVYNEFFRDENLKDRIMINTDDTTQTGSNGTGETDTYITTTQLGGIIPLVAKTHDYRTSALPDVQKGEPVLIPVNANRGLYPVITLPIDRSKNVTDYSTAVQTEYAKTTASSTGTSLHWGQTDNAYNTNKTWKNLTITDAYNLENIPTSISGSTDIFGKTGRHTTKATGTSDTDFYTPINLYADAAQGIQPGTIEELMTAMSIQRILEAFAHGGTRYTEILRNIWGVHAPDQRLQRPEYLGGERIPINLDQVLMSGTPNEDTPIGQTGAFSNTGFVKEYLVNKSFVEHGVVLILGAVRIASHTYQQGLHRFWSRKSKWDFYWPEMANLADQAIYNKEIYAQGTSEDNEVFGYQERWSEYKYGYSQVMGAFRSNNPTGSLDAWHYADYYSELPRLSSEWIDEDRNNVDRTLAVSGDIEDEFFGDFMIESEETRLMPIYRDMRIFKF